MKESLKSYGTLGIMFQAHADSGGDMRKFLEWCLCLQLVNKVKTEQIRTTQWVYEKTIAKSKFIQNTCSGSWFLCKEWKQFNLSEAMLGHHLCSTNHAVIVWESEAKFHYDTTENGWAFLDQLRSVDPSRYGLVVQKLCWYMLYSKILKAGVRYILSDLFQLKNG